MTSDLLRRIYEHKAEVVDGFTKEYGVHRLVYLEEYADARTAIQREKSLKHWVRRWKIELIEKTNPTWRDLYDDMSGA